MEEQWQRTRSAQLMPCSLSVRCVSLVSRLSLLAKVKPERSKVTSDWIVILERMQRHANISVGPLHTCRAAKSLKAGAPQPVTRLLPTKGLDGTLSYRKRKAEEEEADAEPDAVPPPPPPPTPFSVPRRILIAHCI